MSGVFSIASHSVLQYLPSVATHEQIGCAHFLTLVNSMCFLLWVMRFQSMSSGASGVSEVLTGASSFGGGAYPSPHRHAKTTQ
jgi:hypothetical protein